MQNRALFLTVESPFPADNPQKRWEAQIVEILAEQFSVEVLCLARSGQSDNPEAPQTDTLLLGPEKRAVTVSWVDPRGEGFIGKHAIKKTLSQLKPGELRRTYSVRMEQALRERAEQTMGSDAAAPLLWVSRLAMAQYVPLAKKLGYQVVLDKQAAESDLLMDDALSGVRKFALRIFRAAQTSILERDYCGRCDAVVTSSELHASRLLKLVPGAPVQVIPRSVDTHSFEALRGKRGQCFVFFGDLNQPETVLGLTRFAEKVLPRVRAALGPRMPRVLISGTDPSSEFVARMRAAGIEITDSRETPSSVLLAQAAVVFVPNPQPAEDTTQTILEAMSAGRAVLATVRSIEGLVLSPSYDIWVAEKKDQFASLLCRLLNDEDLRTLTGTRAAETVDSRYDWRSTRLAIDQLLFTLRKRRERGLP